MTRQGTAQNAQIAWRPPAELAGSLDLLRVERTGTFLEIVNAGGDRISIPRLAELAGTSAVTVRRCYERLGYPVYRDHPKGGTGYISKADVIRKESSEVRNARRESASDWPLT